MTEYLNKEAMLKELNTFDKFIEKNDIIGLIESGNFDASRDVAIQYQGRIHTILSLREELAGKDSKIKKLELHIGLHTDPKIERLERARDLILGRLQALEDQHRETVPDPEKFICIDLGYPWKKIYVLKEETAKKPGEE